MSDFKTLVYDKIVEILNTNSESLLFDGGYDFVIYNGIPYVIDQSTTEKFDFSKKEVIPVAETYHNETPSVNATDRSDYTCQYELMYRLPYAEQVRTALSEFRDYFFTNKKLTIGNYSVGFKTVRGNKQQSVMVEGGNIYGRYTIDVYLTATRYGYISTDSDIWKMRKDDVITAGDFVVGRKYEIITVGTTDYTLIGASANTVGVEFTATGVGSGTGTVKDAYKTLKLIEDVTAMQGNPIFSNATGTAKGLNTSKTGSSRLRVAYESDYFTKHLYSVVMNKEDVDQTYDLSHTFDSETFTYTAQIQNTSRRNVVNGTTILDVNWIEYDA